MYMLTGDTKTYIYAAGSGTSCFKTSAEAPTVTWIFDASTGAFFSSDNGRFISSDATSDRKDIRAYAQSNISKTEQYPVAKLFLA
jgi:hypothetical protein